MTATTDSTFSAAAHEPQMKRALGVGHLTAIGIGAIVGAGLFSLTGQAAAFHAGPAVILSYLLAAIPAGLTGLCYAELAAMFPASGSCYTYTRKAAGDFAAWVIGWTLILEFGVAAATVATSFSGYTNSLLGNWGIQLPPMLLNGPLATGDGVVPGLINLPAVAIITACSLLLLRGITESAWVNTLIVIVKLVIIVGLVGLGLAWVKPENYVPFIPPNAGTFGVFGWSGVLQATGIIFFSYIGFETVSCAAQETRNPQRDMPLGMLASLLICAVLYVAFSAILVGLVPYTQLTGDAPASTALAATPYHWALTLVDVGILAGNTTSVLTALYGQSRIFVVMAADGMLPRSLASIHPRWRTPWISIILFWIFTGALAGFLPLEMLGDTTSIGTLFAFAAVAACVLILRRTRPDAPRPFRVPLVPLVPGAAIVSCLGLIAFLEPWAWARLLGWLALGLVVWFTRPLWQ
ncbi:MAG TPA: amino acid permease, partial [Stellaceae bacterium]|nr:amino acid permease [Stellaceae bacterium]